MRSLTATKQIYKDSELDLIWTLFRGVESSIWKWINSFPAQGYLLMELGGVIHL